MIPTNEDWIREGREALAKKRRDDEVAGRAAAMEMPTVIAHAGRPVPPAAPLPTLSFTDPRYPPYPAAPASIPEAASPLRRAPAGVPALPPALRRPPERPSQIPLGKSLSRGEAEDAVDAMGDPLAEDLSAPRREDLPSGRLLSVARSMGAGAAGATAAGLRGVDYWGQQLDRATHDIRASMPAAGVLPGAAATVARHVRAIIQSAAVDLFPEDPVHRETFVNKVSSGIGSSIPFLAASIASGGASLPVAATGAIVQSGSAVEEAESLGATPGQTMAAAALSLPVGATEIVGAGSLPGRIARAGTKSIAGSIAREALEEGAQEGTQTWLGNLVMKTTGIDPGRPAGKDVTESAIVAAVSGGAMAGAGHAYRAATPWGQVLADEPHTTEHAEPLEAKVAAGEPLTPDEARMVQHAQRKANEMQEPPPIPQPHDAVAETVLAEQAAQAEAEAAEAAEEATPAPKRAAASSGETREPFQSTDGTVPPGVQAEPVQTSQAAPPSGVGEIRYAMPSTSQTPNTEEATRVPATVEPPVQSDVTTEERPRAHPTFHDTDDIDELIGRATAAEPAVRKWAESFPDALNVSTRVKAKDTIVGKVQYGGRGAGTLSDILGARIIVSTPDEMRAGIDWLEQHGQVLQIKNWLDEEHWWGWPGINVTVVPAGTNMPTEVQLVVPEFVAASENEHQVYEKWRRVKSAEMTPEQFQEFLGDRDASFARWQAARAAVEARVEGARATPPPIPAAAAPAPAETAAPRGPPAAFAGNFQQYVEQAGQTWPIRTSHPDYQRLLSEFQAAKAGRAVAPPEPEPQAEPAPPAEGPLKVGDSIFIDGQEDRPGKIVRIGPRSAVVRFTYKGARGKTNTFGLKRLKHQFVPREPRPASWPPIPPVPGDEPAKGAAAPFVRGQKVRPTKMYANAGADAGGRDIEPRPVWTVSGMTSSGKVQIRDAAGHILRQMEPGNLEAVAAPIVKHEDRIAELSNSAISAPESAPAAEKPPAAAKAERAPAATEPTPGEVAEEQDGKRIRQTEIDRELAEAMAPPETQAPPDGPRLPDSPQDKVLRAIFDLDMVGGPTTPSDVKRVAKKAGITLDQAYDALESNLNLDLRQLRGRWHRVNPPATVDRIGAMAEAESTVVNRASSIESREKQQFSTPLPISEGMALAAAPRPGETVMEPSAGTGNLIEPFVGRDDIRLWVNEFDPARIAVLKGAGYDQAHEGDFFRPLPLSPQVIVSNPPWGSVVTGTGKKKYRTDPISMPFRLSDIAQGHAVHALRSLAAGGRGVFLVGENYFNDSQAPFRKWLAENYALRATVTSPEGAYRKRGTDYGSVMLVVDKVAPGAATVHLKPKDWTEYAAAMDRLATGDLARPTAAALTAAGVAPTINVEAPTRVSGNAQAHPGAAESGHRPAGRPGRRPADGVRGARPGFADDAGGPGPEVVAPSDRERGGDDRGGPAPGVRHGTRRTPSLDELRAAHERDFDEARRSGLFAPYGVRGKWAGSVHPRLVVTTASLASTAPPPLEYRPHPDILETNRRGYISDENMDAIALAAQNNLRGKGLVVADAPGFGKSRQVAGMALDWVKSGHAPRVLVITASQANVTDLITTMNESGVPLPPIVRMTDYKVTGKAAAEAAEIPVHEQGIYLMDAENLNKYGAKIAAIGFDGLIADEADKFTNLDSKRGGAWTTIHKSIMSRREKPFFAYLSGSVGTTVDDLGYLHGLRAWPMDQFPNWLGLISGKATTMAKKTDLTMAEWDKLKALAKAGDEDAINELKVLDAGWDMAAAKRQGKKERFGPGKNTWEALLSPAATEQVIRELADDGLYLSRDLWRNGVEFEMPEMKPSPEKIAALDRRIALMRDIEMAFQQFGRQNKGDDKTLTIRGALQFHYKRALFDLNLDNLITLAKKEAAAGHQVVLSLINVTGTNDEEGEGNLFGAIKAINTLKVSKKDGEAINEGKIPAALEARANLLDRLREEAPALRDPLKTIMKALGKDNVIFVTGQQTAKEKTASIERFQTGQVQFAVISGAGKRGINLHHTHDAPYFGPAAGRRTLIIGDTQWDAPGTLQELGRVDRASQITAPRILIPHLGLSSQRKFLGTIANRMAQIGATSRGMEGATGAEPLQEFTMGGKVDAAAWRKAFHDMPEALRAAFTKPVFKMQGFARGGEDFDPKKMLAGNDTAGTFNDFMLDLQLMPIAQADAAVNAFFKAKQEILDDPKAQKQLGAARSTRARGSVLEQADLNDGMRLYRVKTEGTKTAQGVIGRQEYGILTGKIATTGKVGQAVKAMYSEGDHVMGEETTHARYLSLQDTQTGRWISGMEVPYGKMETVAQAFGGELQGRTSTPDTLLADLASGMKVDVRGPGGTVWTLRKRRDGRTAIDGAKMRDKAALLPSGLPARGAYEPVGNTWWLPDDAVDGFLAAFPIVQNVGAPTSAPRGTVEVESAREVRPVSKESPVSGPPVVPGVQERLDEGVAAAAPGAERGAAPQGERPELRPRVPAAGVVGAPAVPGLRGEGANAPSRLPAPAGGGVAVPAVPAPGADSTDLKAIRRRIDHLRQKIKDVVTVGQEGAIPEIDAELHELTAQAGRLESNLDLPRAPVPLAVGKTDYILTPQGRVTFRYEVVRLRDLIPSHDPVTFRQNPGYPEGVQNRPYHSDKTEQAKVIRQAKTFEPRFVLGTVPDAINGSPIVAPGSNVVLGGNSRAMTMARAAEAGNLGWQEYGNTLVSGAPAYGISTGLLADHYGKGAKDMVLVRRVIPDAGSLAGQKVDRGTLRLLARAFNQPLTQSLNLEADAVSRGMAVSEETQALIASALEASDDGSLSDLLRDRSVVRDLVARLTEDGVFTRQDIGAYMTRDGDLNEAGRRIVELTLLGSVVRDSDLLASAPRALLNKVARALPAVSRLRGKAGWDIADRLRDGMIVAKGAQASGMSVAEFVSQHSLFAGEGPARDVALIAARLVHDRPKRFAQRLQMYAAEGKADPRQGNLGLAPTYTPAESFGANFGGADGLELAGQPVPERLMAQAGFARVGAVAPEPGPTARLVRALTGWTFSGWKGAAGTAPATPTGGAAMPEPRAGGEYAAWIRELGPQKGRAAYTTIRRHQNARALLLRHLRDDTREWFGSLSSKQQAQLFETAKGLRTDPVTGAMLFGGLQPAGILKIRGRKDRHAVGHGVDLPLNQALAGGLLPNGLMIGEPLYDHHAIQLYRIIPEARARARYQQVIQEVPRAAEILDDYKALEEEVRVDPLYGFRLPPRSVEVARTEFNIEVRRSDEVGYVPTILKQPRTFVGKIRRALHDNRSGHRLVKTGEAAEAGLEIQHLGKATEAVRQSLVEEEVRHSLVTTLLPLVLEPRGAGPLPDGYVEFNRGVLKDPQKVIAWANRNRKRLADQGIDVDDFIKTAAQAGGKRYMLPAYAAERLGELFAPSKGSADPRHRALATAAHDFASAAVHFIAANYLIRPSTTVRNFIGNSLNMNAMRLRDAYVGIIQHVIPAARFQELPMAQFVADIVAPLSALGRESREALPAEALGKIFGADLGHSNLPGMALRITGFNADDIWTRRTVYEAVARARAANIYEGLKKAGQPVPPWKQFYRDYRAHLPEEVEHLAWRTNDAFGSFNYENVPRLIENMKKGPVSRAMLLYPTYYYKLLAGPYRELYGPQNYANLFGPGRSKEQRVVAFANILTGASIFALLWAMTPDPWKEYPKGLKDADLPTEYQTTGRLKVPFLKSETDESYWVRALDMPFIGDVMALKAMGAGHLSLSTYLNERLSAGPLALTLMWMFDYQGRFDRYQPLANRLGRQLVSFTPLSPLLMYLRRVTDTYRRRAAIRPAAWMPDVIKDSIQGDPAWESFVAGIMDGVPGLSRQLEMAHANVQPHNPLRYPPAGEHLKFWFLNVKPMRETERQQAIHEAEARKREREEKGLASSWGR